MLVVVTLGYTQSSAFSLPTASLLFVFFPPPVPMKGASAAAMLSPLGK